MMTVYKRPSLSIQAYSLHEGKTLVLLVLNTGRTLRSTCWSMKTHVLPCHVEIGCDLLPKKDYKSSYKLFYTFVDEPPEEYMCVTSSPTIASTILGDINLVSCQIFWARTRSHTYAPKQKPVTGLCLKLWHRAWNTCILRSSVIVSDRYHTSDHFVDVHVHEFAYKGQGPGFLVARIDDQHSSGNLEINSHKGYRPIAMY